MSLEIIYPPLVEQYYAFSLADGETRNKAELYQEMVANGVIESNGLPTEEALEKGWVDIHEEVEAMTFAEFLGLYPVLQRYPADEFRLIDGFWEITVSFRAQLIEVARGSELHGEERRQLEAFLSNRMHL